MASSSQNIKSPAFQEFETADGTPLQPLPVQICPDTDRKCIFWQDIQSTFGDVEVVAYVTQNNATELVLFMNDGEDREVYVSGQYFSTSVLFRNLSF